MWVEKFMLANHRPMTTSARIQRERRTIHAMIEVYCRGRHGTTGALCVECEELLRYASERLEKCPFQESKPTCAKCPIHCYQPKRREQVKTVMKYAGPRMMWKHPIFAIRHLLDGFKEAPPHPARARAAKHDDDCDSCG